MYTTVFVNYKFSSIFFQAELFESVNFVRLKSDEIITDLKSGVDNKIKVITTGHDKTINVTEQVFVNRAFVCE